MVSVYSIIVTYNGAPWIEKCLIQLTQSSYPTKIIVVDNGSTDSTLEILNRYREHIMLMEAGGNLGFGAGNNIGIKKALDEGADFIFLLNQDAYVAPACIEKLMGVLKNNPTYGIISPLQLNGDGSALDHAFKGYLSKTAKETSGKDALIEVRFVNAAAWMMPAAVVKKVGLFHKVFIHYGEDNHYCSRVQYHGYKVAIYTGTSVQHDRQANVTATQQSLLRQLRTVPLYTLLDIRKNWLMAWLLGLHKLSRLKKKLKPYFNDEKVRQQYEEVHQWFYDKKAEARQIRKETQQDATI